MKAGFPREFVWGAATAALQVEGAATQDGRGPSVWDVFCQRHPERIFGGATPEVACDQYHRYEEDASLMQEFGVNGYRLSISWPRVVPTGSGVVNEAGAAYYDRLFDALLARGIEPNVTLFHWDLPQALGEIGGWENPATLEAFERYAEFCFRRYGDRVKLWATFNEPSWMTLNGYVTGLHPPNRLDFPAAVQVATNLLVAHARVVARFRTVPRSGRIGIVLNLSPVYPVEDTERDRAAASLADGIFNRWFCGPVLQGVFPEDIVALYQQHGIAPHLTALDEALLQKADLDFRGVYYDYPNHATSLAPTTHFHLNISGNAQEACRFSIEGLFAFVKNPAGRFTDWGWEIDPNGLEELLRRVHAWRPALPLYVTENGIGLPDEIVAGRIEDDARIAFIEEHLEAVGRALAAGVPVRGYYLWSLLDNFSWLNGYKKRYGLFHVDRTTLARTPKKSAFWWKTLTSDAESR